MNQLTRFALTLFFLAAPAVLCAQQPAERGPIHEAFAQPLDVQPGPGLPLPKGPPPAVPEVPPDQQPEGTNVQWIPGYWAWDADTSDFLWVSGVYRDAPAGRQFVPGSWTSTAEGWRWVAGYWGSAGQPTPPVVPPPPASLEAGPAAPQPDDNSDYIPGSWVYRNTSFAWRPGYWSAFQPGRVWVPAHYVWTPAGYVFIDGYWDLPLDSRGVLFAPVAFNGSPWLDPGWSYTPSYVVNPDVLLDACYYRPRTGFLYYGDYGGPGYANLGFRPWFNGLGRYDPAFSHHVWAHRGTPNWFNNYRQGYQTGARVGRSAVVPLSQYARQGNRTNLVRANPVQVQNRQVQIARSQQAVHVAPVRPVAPSRAYTPPVMQHARATAAPQHPVQVAPRVTQHLAHAAPIHQVAPRVAPARVAPVQHAPARVAPVQHAPARVAPVQHAPARVAPVQHAPARAAPVHTAAVHQAAPARAAKTTSAHHR